MKPLERLEMHVRSELEDLGGILDRIDYRRVRRLGSRLRNIPSPSGDWDVPPASLQGWIASYRASLDCLDIAAESGLQRLLQSQADEILSVLSRDILPAIEETVVDIKTLDELIMSAKDHDRIKGLSFESLQSRLPSDAALARALVVQLDGSMRWDDRPRVDETTGVRRLKLGSAIGQVALGAALAATNIGLGAFGLLTSIVGLAGTQVQLTVALVGSTYTGFNGLLSGLDKVGDALKT